jgi:hypothetical protein
MQHESDIIFADGTTSTIGSVNIPLVMHDILTPYTLLQKCYLSAMYSESSMAATYI